VLQEGQYERVGEEVTRQVDVRIIAATNRNLKEVVADAEIRRRERQNTLLALERCGWKIYGTGGAAELLSIKPTTLSFRIKKWDLKSQRN
jgi:transcriptional regulator with GAF, ATPase, and Fis domain